MQINCPERLELGILGTSGFDAAANGIGWMDASGKGGKRLLAVPSCYSLIALSRLLFPPPPPFGRDLTGGGRVRVYDLVI